MSKYLKYAIGEIVLVVIGILLALQINNLNIRSVNANKERAYLADIKENLENDIARIDTILSFNEEKQRAIKDVFKGLVSAGSPNDAIIVGSRLSQLGQYDPFYPKDLGFQNLISAENIGLIKNNDLRKALLDYYNFDFKTGTQERIEEVTRDFVDYVVPLLSTKERFDLMYNVDMDIPSNEDIDLDSDQKMLSLLHLMDVVSDFQNALLQTTQDDISKLIHRIDNYNQ